MKRDREKVAKKAKRTWFEYKNFVIGKCSLKLGYKNKTERKNGTVRGSLGLEIRKRDWVRPSMDRRDSQRIGSMDKHCCESDRERESRRATEKVRRGETA